MACVLGSSWEKGCGSKFIGHISENSFPFTLDWKIGCLLDRKACFLRMLKPVHHCFLASTIVIKKYCRWLVFPTPIPPFNPQRLQDILFMALLISATVRTTWSGKTVLWVWDAFSWRVLVIPSPLVFSFLPLNSCSVGPPGLASNSLIFLPLCLGALLTPWQVFSTWSWPSWVPAVFLVFRKTFLTFF